MIDDVTYFAILHLGRHHLVNAENIQKYIFVQDSLVSVCC